jgi:hypothetical protein
VTPITGRMMLGPAIVAQTMSLKSVTDKSGNSWQYHSRSDNHSKVTSWAILFDLMRHCSLLCEHVRAGQVAYGINHPMTDFQSQKRKNLDLVLCKPRESGVRKTKLRFAEYAFNEGFQLDAVALSELNRLPELPTAPVGDVLAAFEAKACMTAHQKAVPRFYDELTSAWRCINGSAQRGIAVGIAMVNAASSFVSPIRNPGDAGHKALVVTEHRQPNDALLIQNAARRLNLRSDVNGSGYDAIGILTVVAHNDGTPVTIAPSPPSVPPDDAFDYGMMIRRVAAIYSSRFTSL